MKENSSPVETQVVKKLSFKSGTPNPRIPDDAVHPNQRGPEGHFAPQDPRVGETVFGSRGPPAGAKQGGHPLPGRRAGFRNRQEAQLGQQAGPHRHHFGRERAPRVLHRLEVQTHFSRYLFSARASLVSLRSVLVFFLRVWACGFGESARASFDGLGLNWFI